MTFCQCGCGRKVREGREFISGHNNLGRQLNDPTPEEIAFQCAILKKKHIERKRAWKWDKPQRKGRR